ncbi:hypothetical protein MMC17_003956 [Xylographa soralifera]|nr:hypothetical protein [Xylographa soralifera]
MSPFTVHTSLLFDPQQKTFLRDRSITVDPVTGLITKFFHRQNNTDEVSADDIDLRHHPLVVPGLVDAHTHIFLHAYYEAPSEVQMRDESPTERTIRAVNHVRKALLAGYTTYRDLGTEAMADSDTGIRDAINRGLIPGPRIYAATQPVASSGGYAFRSESQCCPPLLSDVADGVDGVRAAVRRRIGRGADVIKVYADYRKREMRFPAPITPGGPDIQFPPTNPIAFVDFEMRNPNYLLYSQEEMNVLVEEANRADCPVAAHCGSNEAVRMAAEAGVTSIEHGFAADEKTLMAMKSNGCIFVPTLAVLDRFVKGEAMDAILATTKRAWDLGLQLACGGDTGVFPHGENIRELELMVKAGLPLADVFHAATVGGWKACGGMRCGRKFGWWEEGCAADVIAFSADPREDVKALWQVDFVMKDAKVWKKDGQAIGMN